MKSHCFTPTIREHELSVKEELALAEGYAHDGPDEWDEEHLERCLRKAKAKAEKESRDISKEIARIRKI